MLFATFFSNYSLYKSSHEQLEKNHGELEGFTCPSQCETEKLEGFMAGEKGPHVPYDL